MNTVKKGDAFELRVLNIIEHLLESDRLPVNSKLSRIFCKKGYYSDKRRKNIIVDISVECTMPDEPEPTLYLMIECKDYSHPVPVDDIEEFYAKMQQLTGLNVKAIFVTTNILQEGALNVAQAYHMRVMRIKEDNQIEILSFRKEPTAISRSTQDYINATLALTSEVRSRISPIFVGLGRQKVYHTFSAMIEDAILSAD